MTAALTAGNVRVDEARNVGSYGAGTCRVLLDSFDVGDDPGGEVVSVVAAVDLRGDLDGFVERVFDVLAPVTGVTATGFEASYNSVPPGGPDTGRADYAVIEVVTGRRRRTR